jgi:DNA-directed RNA polymerase
VVAEIGKQLAEKPNRTVRKLIAGLEPSHLACITMHEMFSESLSVKNKAKGISSSASKGKLVNSPVDLQEYVNPVKYTAAAIKIGSSVNIEAKLAALRKNKTKLRFLTGGGPNSPSKSLVNLKMLKKLRIQKDNDWSGDDCVRVGAFLVKIVIDWAKLPRFTGPQKGGAAFSGKNVTSETPVFFHRTVGEIGGSKAGFHTTGYIFTHRDALQLVLNDVDVMNIFAPKLMPMIIKPREWVSYDEGGYISVNSKLVRTTGSQTQQNAVAQANCAPVYRGLNYLGSIPWQINRRVLEIVEKLRAEGGGVAELPQSADFPLPHPPNTPDPALLKQFQRQLAKTKLDNANLHSLRCDLEYKLTVARRMSGREIFYPFNIDFRGRAYPIPPHLNHLGNDISRGLLLFSLKKPLGASGLSWLKIHAANLFGGGIDKQPTAQRIAWAEQNMEKIKQSAGNPLHLDKSKRWWLKAEKPFQFLALCTELSAALASPDPSSYLCGLPVHQDGSCNGLQHYAALGRDIEGAVNVNLFPSDRPQDVYQAVCNRVIVTIEKDFHAGNAFAALLLGKINRKLVKQTVMTSVYGVTNIGAREQIKNRLLERSDIEWPEAPESMINQTAMYLAKITLKELYTSFKAARQIQNWLGECSNLITSQAAQPVSWLTPLGLPVMQPYRRIQSYTVRTALQSVTLTDDSDLLPVSGNRQKSAFPPNFIHSLDATHMLMTALRCKELGLTFTAVHDSYWTHACDVETMNKALREQFISLYSQPILEDLRNSWVARFPQLQFKPVPERGQFDLNQVLNSPYFFS